MTSTKHLIALLLALGIFPNIKAQTDSSVQPEFEITYNKPEKILKLGDNHYFIDFGQAYFGTLTIESGLSQKDSLFFHLGEELAHPAAVNRSPKGTIRYDKIGLPGLERDRTIDIALGRNKRNTNPPAVTLPDSFGVVIPFRYCEIENLKIPINELNIRQKAYHYTFNDEASSFSSSDTVLNQIWDLCKHTVKATSFTGYYIDGDRERIPYEADAYINQLSHYAVDSVYSLAQRTNEYFINHPTWPTEWILHTAKMFYLDYLYSGNKQLISKYYDNLKAKTLLELARRDGLISTKSDQLNDQLMSQLGFSNPQKKIRDIVDWPMVERDGYEFTEINTVVNAFYYENLRVMSLIADAFGHRQNASFYRRKAHQVKRTINKKLFDKSTGLYIDGEGSNHSSLHANMFPLAFGLVPNDNLETVVGFIKSKGMACSVYGAQYLLEALYRNGESAYAQQIITDTSHLRTWWNMIKTGSTMTLEAWDMKYKPNLDWNHAWGTAPANIITMYMWGVQPNSPGYKEMEIYPQLDELTHSEITVPTTLGPIHAKFSREDDRNQVFEIQLPKSMKGHFKVPVEKYKELEINGRKMRNKKHVTLNPGLNVIRIQQ